jgi:hypothetical protein
MSNLVKDPSTSSYIPKYDPDVQTWKSYDMKIRVVGMDLEFYEEVLTKYKIWEETDEDGKLKYTTDQITKMKKADTFARRMYILGSTKKTQSYINAELTAYEIR